MALWWEPSSAINVTLVQFLARFYRWLEFVAGSRLPLGFFSGCFNFLLYWKIVVSKFQFDQDIKARMTEWACMITFDRPFLDDLVSAVLFLFCDQLLELAVRRSRTGVNPREMACTGWTRMPEAIQMHSWLTVTWRHTMEDGPCVTLLMSMSNPRLKSHTPLSFLMGVTATGPIATTSR